MQIKVLERKLSTPGVQTNRYKLERTIIIEIRLGGVNF